MRLPPDYQHYSVRLFILCVATAVILPALNMAAYAADKIRMSVSGSYNITYVAAGVAHHKGFFRDEGIDADIVVMTAPASLAALTNGDLDYTMLTGSVIRAAIR